MTHADTLRGMASDEHILAGRENARSTALLAGVEALDTLTKVREALDRVDQEWGRYPTPAPDQRHSPYNAGYLDGLDTAHTWINEALGGTP